jgi:riboflavin transporter FmnP
MASRSQERNRTPGKTFTRTTTFLCKPQQASLEGSTGLDSRLEECYFPGLHRQRERRASPVQSQELRVMTSIGLLSALSFVLMLLEVTTPFAIYLKYDPSDVAALIGGFTLGPGPGGLIVVLRNVLRALLVNPDFIGLAMNTVAGAAFVMVSATYYRYRLTRRSAALALGLGGLAQILTCIPAAQVALPLYGIPKSAVGPMLWTTIVPFNILKTIANGLLTFYFYKQVARSLPRLRSDVRGDIPPS